MKKTILAIAAVFSALAFSSCSRDRVEPCTSMQTVLITVDKDKWQYSAQDNNNYFKATVNMPEITENVFDKGLVKMYRTYDFNGKNPSQVEMPFTRHNEIQNKDGDWIFYTETVDYEYGIGSLNIFYTASDFDYELDETFVPDAMQFRCVVVY